MSPPMPMPSASLVNRGESVAKGQVIAYAGETGDVTEPQLHFEIRARYQAGRSAPAADGVEF